MRTERHDLARGLALGAFIGGAIGATVALLYAPKSGRELRLDMTKKTGDLLTEAEQLIDKAKTATTKAADETKRKILDEETRLKDAFKAGVDAYKQERVHS